MGEEYRFNPDALVGRQFTTVVDTGAVIQIYIGIFMGGLQERKDATAQRQDEKKALM